MVKPTAGRLLKVIFNYESSQMPPPFSHKYRIELDLENKDPFVNIYLKYTDRDELSEDEIMDEGYTLNDDFEWKGILPQLWKEAVLAKINQSNFIKNKQPSSGHIPFLELTLVHSNENTQHLIPAEEKTWEPFLQEIIQAGFEKAGKEKPLLIRFVSIVNKKTTLKELVLSFADRNLLINIGDGNANHLEKKLSWQSGQKLMKNIYILEYPVEKGIHKFPSTEGNYIDMGDGIWYDLDKDVDSPTNRKDLVKELIGILDNY